jgi:FkbM family methyltransferase
MKMEKISQAFVIMKVGFHLMKISRNFYTPLLAYAGLIKEKELVIELRDGTKILCRPKGGDLSVIVELQGINYYKFPKRKQGVVIDIGAHIGVFTLLASKYAERVFAFEPCPENFKILKRNIRLNSLSNVKAYQMAVAANKGEGDFYILKRSTVAHSLFNLKKDETEKVIKVRKITLKDVIDENRIDSISFLKMDCEGCEYEVLVNLPKEYFIKIDEIALESHNGYGDKVEKILRENGFKVIREGRIIHGFKQNQV